MCVCACSGPSACMRVSERTWLSFTFSAYWHCVVLHVSLVAHRLPLSTSPLPLFFFLLCLQHRLLPFSQIRTVARPRDPIASTPPPGGTFALKERRRERAVIIFAVSYSFRSTCASPLPLPPTHTRCYGLLPPSCLSAVCRSFWVFSVGFCALCLRHRSLSSRVPLISSLSLPFLACCSGARALPLFVHAIIYHWLVGCIILKLAERNQRHQEAEGTKENNKETKAVFSSCAPSRL